MNRLYVKWYGKPKPVWTVARIIWAMGSLLVFVLIAMALWRYRSVVKLNRELRETIAGRKTAEKAVAEKSALLDTTFENMSQGLVVIDADLKLAAFNQRYIDFRGYPPGFIRIGMPLEEIIRFNAERGEYGPVADIDALVRERVAARRKGERATGHGASAPCRTAGSSPVIANRCPTAAMSPP